ncbi:orotate phosphoribosyltransferase [Candidatus Woesearchaeota archaeon]|nr:MAG: orotate phosphoribosyltransferase [Candidatus Woesearchaeota archaeon]
MTENSTAQKVAKLLLSIKAVTLNMEEPYRYASGILSPIYCDNRLIMSYPEIREKVIDSFLSVITEKELEFDVVAGTATAGIPHAAWVADRLKKPMIYVRSSAKDHGKKNLIEGKLENGQKVLLIEDLVSTGGSSISAVKAIKESGGDVVACLAIFTYGMEKAEKAFKEENCPLFTLSNFNTLINTAVEENYLSPEQAEKAVHWNRDPQGWGAKMGFE